MPSKRATVEAAELSGETKELARAVEDEDDGEDAAVDDDVNGIAGEEDKLGSALTSPHRELARKPDAFEQAQSKRGRVFIFLLIAQLLINCDYGILAAALVRVQATMHMSWLGIGSLSSIIYFTLSLTTVPMGFILQRYPGSIRKLLGVSLVCNGLCSICCGLAPNAIMLTTLLALDGIFQSVPYVYLPVWVNQFAPPGSSTSWMGYLQNTAQVGTIFGYAGTALTMHTLADRWWRMAFVTQGGAIILAALAMLQFGEADLSLADELGAPAAVPIAFEASAHATIRLLCRFRRHRAFWYTMFAAGALYFVGNGLNYWTSLYLVSELGAGAKFADVVSVVVSVVGPVFGTWAGARYVDFIGGYKDNHARALEACILLSLMAVLALPHMCFSQHALLVSGALLAVLALVAALTPALAGIVLDILPEELRPLASGLYGLGTNMLGFGMSTLLGGGAMHVTGSITFGWRFNALVVLLCPLLLLFARATIGLQVPVRIVLRDMAEQLRTWVNGFRGL